MLTKEQVANLKKGDTIIYNNNGRKSEWTVDYPKQLINQKHKITVFEGDSPKRVALETPAGGGECTNSEYGCVRVSMLTPTGRGHNRFSMLVTEFENWELPEEANNVNGSTSENENTNNSQTSETQVPSGSGGTQQTQQQVSDPISLISLNPSPDGILSTLNSPIILTFSGSVKAGSGMISLNNEVGAHQVNIEVPSDLVQFNDNVVTITLSEALESDAEYNVTFDNNSILDMNDNPVDVLGNNVYKFSTPEN